MLLLSALALAATAPAALAAPQDDVRQAFQQGLALEVYKAIAEDHNNYGLSSEQLAKRLAERAAVANSFILGIGDPENYHPYPVPCPQFSNGTTWVRPATEGLGAGEKAYLAKRKPIIDDAVAKMMAAHGLPTPPRTPTIGIALSGGGYRAMINGLGMTQALMNESPEAAAAGTGGWFDALSYMAGLSGGSWATGSFMANNAPLPTDLITNVWNLDQNLIFPSDGKVAFYTNMLQNVREKADAGFPTQITDYWALALGEHLLPEAYRMANGANLTFSQLPNVSSKFQNASVPFPIIIAAEREPGETLVAENTTIWEFTPYEFGSWAVGVGNLTSGFFSPIEYMGTSLVGGSPNGTCYSGFDQLSFVMGTSSTLFNYGIVQLAQANESSVLVDWANAVLEDIGHELNDISQVINPSYQHSYTAVNITAAADNITAAGDNGTIAVGSVNASSTSPVVSTTNTNPISHIHQLTLIDAGETNQNIPMEPLLLRGLDTVLAFDNSADTTYSWPNGSALWTTYQRALAFQQKYNLEYELVEIPSTNTFVNKGLNTRPVFFGCNQTDMPLVVYVPHYPWTYYSNSTTFTLQYDSADATAQMLSSMRSLTLNGTVPTWPKCLSCAMTDRANGYTAENRTAECAECFNTWCWNGEKDDSTPAAEYAPVAGVTPEFLVKNNLSSDVRTTPIVINKDKKSGAVRVSALPGAAATALAVLAAGMLAML